MSYTNPNHAGPAVAAYPSRTLRHDPILATPRNTIGHQNGMPEFRPYRYGQSRLSLRPITPDMDLWERLLLGATH